MSETKPSVAPDYTELSADIVSAFVSNNSIPASELGNLLTSVHAAVTGLAKGGNVSSTKDEIEKATPAQIKKSITQDALISFEDGKPYKTLRRHLTIRGLTPEDYRAKHGLPVDYPMISAGYSAQRSKLAKALGLGQQRRGTTQSKETADEKPKLAGHLRKVAAAE